LRRALGCFRQALDEDPTYALAYVGVADCYDLLSGLGLLPPREGYPKAKAAALNALELDGELAEAHASLGHLHMRYHWDWEAAEGAYRRALALNPNYATAHHWYATYLTAMGRHEEAIAEGRLAQQLDPLSPIINLFIGVHFFFARRYEEALAHIRKTVVGEPAFVLARTFQAQAAAYVGNHDEALTALAEAERLGTDKGAGDTGSA
jgi:tetratricopeptide (TPR) repeat protein